MKRKKIEAVPPLEAPKGNRNKIYKAAVVIKKIADEKIMLMDIYRSEKPKEALLRIALSDNDFGNYDFILKKWNKKRFETGEIKPTGYIDSIDTDNCFINEEDKEKIRKFTKKHNSYITSYTGWIREMQRDISYDKQRKARQKRIENLDRRCENMPEIPEDYEEWLLNNYLSSHYLYYKRKGSKVQIKCSNCNCRYEYRIKETTGSYEEQFEPWGMIPTHNARGRCRKCDCKGIYKAEGKQKGMETKKNTFVIQKYSDDTDTGLVVRFFWNTKRSFYDERKAVEELAITEIARAFFMNGKKTVQLDYNKHNPWSNENFWDDCNLYGMSNIKIEAGVIYPGSYEELGSSSYKYCALNEYMNDYDNVNVASYLKTYNNLPALEMIVKSGMKYLATELIDSYANTNIINKNAVKIEDLLKIKKTDIKALIRERGRTSYLSVLQFEREADINLTESERDYLVEMMPNYRDLVRVVPYVTVRQIINRTGKYSGIAAEDIGDIPTCAIGTLRNTARTYIDYLVMLLEEGYDMENTVDLYPRDLMEAHNKLALERNKHALEKEMQEKNQKYPEIKKTYRRLLKEYRYETGEYKIRPARSAEEIILEGKTLHHCAGGDNYLSSHNRQESIILFLRYKKKDNIPFITIELDTKNKTVKQWYGINNTQPNKNNIENLLNSYLKQLVAT